MIKYLRSRKNKESAKVLYENVTKLLSKNCDIVNLNNSKKLHTIYFSNNNSICYQHNESISDGFTVVPDSFYRIDGVKVFTDKIKDYTDIPVFIYDDKVNEIELNFHTNISQEFTINDIIINQLTIDKIKIHNPNYDDVLKILNTLSTHQLDQLDIDNTIEIEIDDMKFYTIIDMQDGNYLAMDRNQCIYRMMHDNPQQYKHVFNNIHDFLNQYNGDKESLEELFES